MAIIEGASSPLLCIIKEGETEIDVPVEVMSVDGTAERKYIRIRSTFRLSIRTIWGGFKTTCKCYILVHGVLLKMSFSGKMVNVIVTMTTTPIPLHFVPQVEMIIFSSLRMSFSMHTRTATASNCSQ